MKKNSKKVFARLAVFISVTALLISGCQSAADKTDSENKKQTNTGKSTVVFAYWGAETENQAIKNVIADFEAKNPNIKIEPQWIQKDYLTKVQVQIAGDTMADVYLMSAADLAAFSDNYIVQEAKSENYLSENVIDSLKIDGELKAKPFIIKPKVMAINKNLFEAKGVSLPSLTEAMTVEEFEACAKQVTDSSAEPQIFASEPLWMGNWIYSFGGTYYKNDGTESNLDSKETIEAADYVIHAKESGYVPDDTQKQGQNMMDWFLSGRIAMYTDFGPWNIPQMADVKGFDWDLVQFPEDGGAKEVDGLSITKKAKDPKAAQIFVDYLCESDSAQTIIGGDKSAYGVPVNPNVVKNFESIYEGKNLSAFVQAAENQRPSEAQKKMNEIGSVFKKVEDETKVGTGKGLPKDVFPSIAKEITAVIQQ